MTSLTSEEFHKGMEGLEGRLSKKIDKLSEAQSTMNREIGEISATQTERGVKLRDACDRIEGLEDRERKTAAVSSTIGGVLGFIATLIKDTLTK